MKKIISFSLWGQNTLYTSGAIWNAIHVADFFPEWICRFYHDNTVPQGVLDILKDRGAELISMLPSVDVLGMFWRFQPMYDSPDVERFIVRDTDSRLSQRDADAVNNWCQSGKPFHIIRDCESHNVLILGGTWGAVPACVPNFKVLMQTYLGSAVPYFGNPKGLFHGVDQDFLGRVVWPYIAARHVAHVRAGCQKILFTGKEIELPPLCIGEGYVGMVQ